MSEFACTKCPLYKDATNILVPGKGSLEPKIMFVGIAPGWQEDRDGECFIGAAGKKLMSMIKGAKIDMDEVRFENLVRCAPWQNKVAKKVRDPEQDEVIKCSPYLLAAIKKYKPRVIVPLGGIPTYFFLPHLGPKLRITKYSGVAFTWEHPETGDECTVIPTVHPAALCRSAKYEPTMADALALIKQAATGKSVDLFDDCNYMYLDSEWKIEQYVDMVIEKYLDDPDDPMNVISADIESGFVDPLPEDCPFTQKEIALSPYNPYNVVVSVQLSHAPNHGALIPLWHKDSPLRDYNDIKMVAYHLQRLFDVVPVIGQNFKFDFGVFYTKLGVTVKKVAFDTMLAQFLMWQKSEPLGLEDMAGRYVDMPMFKQEMHKALESLPEEVRHMGNVDLDKLIRYGCGDADAVFRLYIKFREMLISGDLWNTYQTVLVDATPALGWIEIAGMVIDPDRLETLKNEYIEDLNQLLDEIRSSWFIDDFNEVTRESHDRKVLAAKNARDEKRAEEGKEALKDRNWSQDVLDKREAKLQEKLAFNPGSSDHLRKLFYHYRLMGFDATSKTKTDKPSTDKKARREILEQATKKIDELRKNNASEDEIGFYEDAIELVEKISEWTRNNKLYSAYIKSAPKLIHDTGDIAHLWPIELPPEVVQWAFHSNFKIHGTDTGRLSCVGPNLQQMPATSAIKWMFISRFADIGGVLLQGDYSQAELRVLAKLAEEDAMTEAFERGEDIHMFVAKLVFGALGQTDITKEMRRIAKRASFGIMYGQGKTALAYEFGTTEEEAESIIETIFSVFPNLRAWMDTKEAEARNEGFVTSPMGRIRWIENADSNNVWRRREANRKAVNTPIQSAASDWTLCSLNEIAKRFRELKLKSVLVATIHDSIMVDVYPGELLKVIEIMKNEMVTRLPQRFKWMQGMTPKVDFEFGVDWKSMTDIEELPDGTYKIKGSPNKIKDNLFRLMEGECEVEQLDFVVDDDNADDSWAQVDLELEHYVSI